MQTNIHTLTEQIQTSKLLTEVQKQALTMRLRTLDEAEQAQLQTILESENSNPTSGSIAAAATAKNQVFFAALDEVLTSGSKAIRKAEEAAEQSDDNAITEDIFTNAT